MVVDPDPGKKMAAGTYFDSGNRWMMVQNTVLKPRARRYT